MSGEPPGIVGRLGLVIYWVGCIAAVGGVLVAVSALVLHDPDPDGSVARSKVKANTPACIEAKARWGDRPVPKRRRLDFLRPRDERDHALDAIRACGEADSVPYPWAIVGISAGISVAAWFTGRALRFILKGD